MNLSLLDASVKEGILARIDKLTPDTNAIWGKMNVSQMLAHLQAQIRVALGDDQLPKSLLGKLFGGWMRKQVLTEKPYAKSLPTAPSFVMRNNPDFKIIRESLKEHIIRFNTDTITKVPHPYFGKMTIEEWSTATWKHLDHHLKQFGV